MRIAVLGTGRIGAVVGRRWAAAGNQVVFGTRTPEDAAVQALAGDTGAGAASPADAAQGADVVVLALPHGAVEAVVSSLGDLTGKIVVDCTNAVGQGYTPDVGDSASGVARIAELAPGARVVKAFNTLGSDVLAALDPAAGDTRAVAFACGDDEAAKAVVAELAAQLGLRMVDVGPLAAAPLVESVALLWITLSSRMGWGRTFVIETRQLENRQTSGLVTAAATT